MARARLTRGQWPLVGLAALAVVTAILVMLAALKTWAPPDEALPGPVRGASTAPASTLSKPAPATADASRQDLNGVADIIKSPRGGSILVVGDGSGDEMEIPAQLDAVLEAVRAKSQTASVVVLIQNPDRARTEAIQQETTQAIKKWADAKGFPTVDIYSAFTGDPSPRDGLVEVDGSPTPQGSRLWAETVADALAAPPAR